MKNKATINDGCMKNTTSMTSTQNKDSCLYSEINSFSSNCKNKEHVL